MTLSPKEKAKELVDKYFKGSDLLYHDLSWIQSKECALIAVDEILNNFGLTSEGKHFCNYYTLEYYQQVKTEIELL
jgi:hypothetical protein